ncbi:MAG TPA: DUF1614 domain-containing protein [Peptococcaceae bacterium]|jgi:uncharacterized membrane protein|nr:DUF1614 domain-containing protein [Peptococcaceae bacterium]HQD53341.1 DUF1614 domain-containing protein [Peptococcaceae bacterium]
MTRLPLGTIVLVVVSLLVYFGLAHRLLDRMRLTDKQALIVLGALIVGSFIDIPLSRGNINVTLNVGGALVPLGLAVYLLTRAGTTKEWGRSLLATAVTAGLIYFLGSILMTNEPYDRRTILDPLYVYPLVAGVTAYVLGRSRRAAFVAATLGVLSLDVIHYFWLLSKGVPGTVHFGGAGAFDSIVFAGLVAILLAEIFGESRERLQGGPISEGHAPSLLKHLRVDKESENEMVKEDGDEHEEKHH